MSDTPPAEHDHEPEVRHSSPPINLILGLVLGAMALFFLLWVTSQYFGQKNEPSAELTALQKEIDEARAEVEAQRLQRGISPGGNPEALGQKIKSDVDSLAALVSGMENELRSQRDLQSSFSSLSRLNEDLRRQLDAASAAQGQVAGLQARLQESEQRLEILRQQLSNAPAPGTAAELEQTRAQLAELRGQTAGMVDGSRMSSLQKLIDELQLANDRYREEIQRLRAEVDGARLFVTRENLSPRATALFKELTDLEGRDPDQLELDYSRLDSDLNARMVGRVEFAEGSNTVNVQREEALQAAIQNADPASFFLVVGYASQKGEAEPNRELSRQRATRVASIANFLKQAGQEVQAVYLGETERFGSDLAANQICEIWEIRP